MRRFAVSLALVLTACGSSDDAVDTGPGVASGAGGNAAGAGGGGGIDSGATGGSSGQAGSGGKSDGGSGGSATGGSATGGSDAASPRPDAGPPAGCTAPGGTTALPPGAPALVKGTWTKINPAGVNFHGGGNDVFTQGIALDPCNAGTLYLSVSSFDVAGGNPGVFKTTDAGSTWTKVGKLDEPIHIRIDPSDPQHLYAVDGVRGGTEGFWVSHDGGATWTMPPGFDALKTQVYQYDSYDVAMDPWDFKHVLVTSHSPWNGWNAPYNAAWGNDTGVLESKDGGDTWTLRGPIAGSGTGCGVWFLTDSSTWLFGSQGGGFFRTTDGGVTFTQVSTANMQHGGGGVFRTKSGIFYAAGTPQMIRSKDDGATWTKIGPSSGFNAVIGDGTTLYTAPVFGPAFVTAPESDDTTWTAFAGGPALTAGPFEMAFDEANGIIYAANWSAGVWALKVK